MPPGTGAEAEHVDSEITENQLSVSTEEVDVVKAEDGIRDQPRSRGLGDVYKRQV